MSGFLPPPLTFAQEKLSAFPWPVSYLHFYAASTDIFLAWLASIINVQAVYSSEMLVSANQTNHMMSIHRRDNPIFYNLNKI